jgi:sugar-specific transcriptional regulator TrmB
MVDDSEFITKLIGFGLSEKEARLYLHLLKYGSKPPSLLAKSLKTYREDVHRTLTDLIDKGMVKPSLEAPTVYTAVDLEVALGTALKKHESELREMEVRRQELQAMSQQLRFRPSDEFATFKIIKSLKELVSIGLTTLNSSGEEWLMVCPPIFSVVGSLYALEDTKKFIDRGGR